MEDILETKEKAPVHEEFVHDVPVGTTIRVFEGTADSLEAAQRMLSGFGETHVEYLERRHEDWEKNADSDIEQQKREYEKHLNHAFDLKRPVEVHQKAKELLETLKKRNKKNGRSASDMYVKLEPIDMDAEFFYDMKTEQGFRITDPPLSPLLDDDNKKHVQLHGPLSPYFGTIPANEEEASMRYSCDCGYFHDEMFTGQTCPFCGSEIHYMETNIKMTGWISLGTKLIVNPLYYMKMKEILGKKKVAGKQHIIIEDILDIKQKVDVNGMISRPTEEELDSPPTSEFHGIGITEFAKNFEAIMWRFWQLAKNPDKKKRIERLIRDKHLIFYSHIPVYTHLLRPQSSSGNTLYYNKKDKQINPIINMVDKLDQCQDIDLDAALWSIQKRVNDMWDYDYSLIHGKEGMIRGQIKGGSLNYTARDVIIPDASLRVDQVDVGYSMALTIFQNQILNYYMNLYSCNLSKAMSAYTMAQYRFSEEFYHIMVELCEKDDWQVVINRNPTLNMFSMLKMRIRHIIPDIHCYIMSIPLFVLKGLNADFDGDVMNIIGLVSPEVKKMFERFDPTENMVIDFNTGYLNPMFQINFGMKVDLLTFCTA